MLHRKNCNARCVTNVDLENIRILTDGTENHLHPPNVTEARVRQVLNGIRRRARGNPTESPGSVVRQELAGVHNEQIIEEIYEEFVKKAAAKGASRKVGDPYASDTQQGPQVDDEMFNKVLTLIESGKAEGAKVECGGGRWGTQGYFVQPTVFSNVTDNMRIAREEIFGPVQTIIKFKTLEEAIARANDTTYGLAAGIITKDLNKALVFSQSVHAGSVWVNCYDAVVPQAPFGGYKQSGFGRELGEDSLKEYLEVKTVTIKMPYKI
ncbi:Retinal dehydrogenase 1 [Periplaneta americana]|uniref:Retinal dehydrogenase 1 n=1 Tax=Periplaneta americana TaxID=6978 RepID=A0ABQ8TIJ2_PERAM|nr:Retinal dehydrogenase 1 [Periplaneta americana]